MGLEPAGSDARYRGGQPHHGVVGVIHRAVTWLACGAQAHPGEPLLRGLEQVEARTVVERDAEAAHLADRLVAVAEQLGMVLGQPPRAGDAPHLLVGEEGDDEVPRRSPALPCPAAEHGQDHGIHVLHVHRAPAPDAAVDDLAAERVHRPLGGFGRNHVEMAVHE